MDECPAYRASSGGTAGDDVWSGTDDNNAYEKMLKHAFDKHITDVPAEHAELHACLQQLIVTACAVTS